MRTACFCLLGLLALCSACATTRLNTYEKLLDARVGKARKPELDRILGSPTFCAPSGDLSFCEYRTTAGQHGTIPDMNKKMEAFGPDLSPYDRFDVLHLFYDGFGTLREWQPYVIMP